MSHVLGEIATGNIDEAELAFFAASIVAAVGAIITAFPPRGATGQSIPLALLLAAVALVALGLMLL